MTLLLALKKYGQLAVIIVLFVLLSLSIGENKDLIAKNATWEAYVEDQDNAINQLRAANDQFQKQQIDAYKKSEVIRNKGKDNVNVILNTPIDSKCEKAIKDGIALKEKYKL